MVNLTNRNHINKTYPNVPLLIGHLVRHGSLVLDSHVVRHVWPRAIVTLLHARHTVLCCVLVTGQAVTVSQVDVVPGMPGLTATDDTPPVGCWQLQVFFLIRSWSWTLGPTTVRESNGITIK